MSVMITGMWVVDVVIVSTTMVLVTRLSYCKAIVIDSYFCDHWPLYRMACNANSANSIMAKDYRFGSSFGDPSHAESSHLFFEC
ncbi:unnamed protein product [Coregonus sp. 'balchen']|nr:unnamed protein product [Coregonus sp. 'balchen']